MCHIESASTPEKTAQDILELLTSYHRGWHTEHTSSHEKEKCFHPNFTKIISYVRRNLPMVLILPAFPAKSSNRDKTATSLPDLGELLSLKFLNELCKKIQAIYAPGAHLVICSDGRVFNDVVHVSDEQVDAYMRQITHLIQHHQLQHLTTFKLDDYYLDLSYTAMRNVLVDTYGEPLPELKARIHSNDADKMLWNGIHRFIFEDSLYLLNTLSRNKIRTLSKDLSYQTIQRSNAWSRLLQECFPEAIRLSIHPQPCASEKLGIMLLKSKDHWATPWHRVVLLDQGEHWLVKQSEAISLGAKPVFIEGCFSHYEHV